MASSRDNWLRAALVAGLIALFTGSSAPWWLHAFNGHGSSGATTTSTTGATITRPNTIGTPVTPATPATTASPATGCVLTISDPFAEIHDTPDFSQQSGNKVPPGSYQPSDNRVVSFGGADTRWFQISAAGKTGWIPDDGIEIDSKTSACP